MLLKVFAFLLFLIPSLLQRHTVAYSCNGQFDLQTLRERYPEFWPVFLEYTPYKGKEKITFSNGAHCDVFGVHEADYPSDLNLLPMGLGFLWLLGFLIPQRRNMRKLFAFLFTTLTTTYFSFTILAHFFIDAVGYGIFVYPLISLAHWIVASIASFYRSRDLFHAPVYLIFSFMGFGIVFAGHSVTWPLLLIWPFVPVCLSLLVVASYGLVTWKPATAQDSGETSPG